MDWAETLELFDFEAVLQIPSLEIGQFLHQLVNHFLWDGIIKSVDDRGVLFKEPISSSLPVNRATDLSTHHLRKMVQTARAARHKDARIMAIFHDLIKLARDRQAGLPEHIGGYIDLISSHHLLQVIVVDPGYV